MAEGLNLIVNLNPNLNECAGSTSTRPISPPLWLPVKHVNLKFLTEFSADECVPLPHQDKEECAPSASRPQFNTKTIVRMDDAAKLCQGW